MDLDYQYCFVHTGRRRWILGQEFGPRNIGTRHRRRVVDLLVQNKINKALTFALCGMNCGAKASTFRDPPGDSVQLGHAVRRMVAHRRGVSRTT